MRRSGRWFACVGLALVCSMAMPGAALAKAGKTVAVKQYVKSICTSTKSYLDTAVQLKTAYQTKASTLTDPTAARDAYATLIGDLATAESTLIADLTRVGAPRIKGGSKLATAFVKLFKHQLDVLHSAQASVQALPTDDVQKLQAGLTAASNAVQGSISTAGYDAVKKKYLASDAAIGRAAKANPACAGLPL